MQTEREYSSAARDIDALRREYLAILERLGTVSREVHQALDDGAAALSILREHIGRGGNVSDFAELIHPIPLRAGLAASLTELERTRHQSQKVLFRLLIAEGMNMSAIGRMWGISRQLVSRLVNEPD